MSGHKKWSEIKRKPGVSPTRPRYWFTVERDGDFWFVKADDLPRVFTQTRRLDQVEVMARDATALMLDIDRDSFDVSWAPKLAEPLHDLVQRAATARVRLELLQLESAHVNTAAVHRLVDKGYSLRDIGRLLGLSFQRIGQLAKAPAPMMNLEAMTAAAMRGATDRPEEALVASVQKCDARPVESSRPAGTRSRT